MCDSVIEHIHQIDIIEEIIARVSYQTGISLTNVSYWNVGKAYQAGLLNILELPKNLNITDYLYSYDITDNYKSRIFEKLGFKSNAFEYTIFASATSAISSIVALLYKIGVQSTVLLQPAYYTVQECFKYYRNITQINIPLLYFEATGKYSIPIDTLKQTKADMIWITQPVFPTGVYLQINEIEKICELYSIVVLDCSLCEINQLKILVKHLPQNIILINCPHKLIGLNNLKFCLVISEQYVIDILEDVIDIFNGGLPITSYCALQHFLTTNYDLCDSYAFAHIREIRTSCEKIFEIYKSNVMYNRDSSGIYGLITIRNQRYSQQIDYAALEATFRQTLTAFFPNNINNGLAENGYSFRINYTLDKTQLLSALHRLFSFLEDNPYIL